MPHMFGLRLIRISSLRMAFFRHVMTLSIVRLMLFWSLQLLMYNKMIEVMIHKNMKCLYKIMNRFIRD